MTTKITVAQLFTLYAELNGNPNINPPTTGLLRQRLNWAVKFDLDVFSRSLKDPYEAANETQTAIITKLGKKDDEGRVSLEGGSPEYKKFIAEMEPVLKKEVEIKVPAMKPEVFKTVDTEEYYPEFMELLRLQKEEPAKNNKQQPDNQVT